MYNKKTEFGIIEIMPENSSKKAMEDALQKKEIVDAITTQDFSGKVFDDILKEAIMQVLELKK
jgi:hypothetical protein